MAIGSVYFRREARDRKQDHLLVKAAVTIAPSIEDMITAGDCDANEVHGARAVDNTGKNRKLMKTKRIWVQ